MDRSMGTLVAFAAVILLLAGPAAAVFDGYDGMPRPNGTDFEPTTTYGPTPSVKYNNRVAKCIWYGWENFNYPPDATHKCSSLLWSSLSASNPAGLSAYMYYVPQDSEFYDPQYEEYLCAIGCFDLSAAEPSGDASSHAPAPQPPAVAPTLEPPTPPAAEPPTVTTPPPSPLSIGPPPPATLFEPPPPADSEPPTFIPPAPTPPAGAPSPVPTPSSPPPALLPPTFGPSRAVAPGSFVPIDSAATTTVASTLLTFAATLFLTINLLV